jgi:CubicO group peptidase (beta-lactamase class C family)
MWRCLNRIKVPFVLALVLLGIDSCKHGVSPPSPIPVPANLEGPVPAPSPGELTDAMRKAKIVESIPELEKQFAAHIEKQNLPGMAVGIVVGDELVYAKGFGLRDLEAKAPVDADTVFRIASMTKSFTALAILKLRDEGKLSLEDLVATYIPDAAKLTNSTRDSAPLTIRQLLSHSAGFPEDNAWGDPRLDLSERDFSALLRRGLSLSTSPGTHYEYSNLGFALLGRIVQRASGVPYQEYVTRRILRPLGMTATTWDRKNVRADRLAVGYGRSTGPFGMLVRVGPPPPTDHTEKQVADGAFASMGGLYTSIRDFARYTSFQLSASPPRDEPDHGPVRRSSVREMQQMARFNGLSIGRLPNGQLRASGGGYGYGFGVSENCDFERVVTHGGGLPGFGSFVSLFPEQGVAIFAFANATYSAPGGLVADVARTLKANGAMEKRPVLASKALSAAHSNVLELLDHWDEQRASRLFDRTFFQYNPESQVRSGLDELRARHGECKPVGALEPENALRGKLRWTCERGEIDGEIALTPDNPPLIQWVQLRGRVPPNERLLSILSRLTDAIQPTPPSSIDELLAPSVDKQKIKELLAATSARYGACQLKRWMDGDGDTFARTELNCKSEPLEADIRVDPAGRVEEFTLLPAQDPKAKCPS